jgi:hypothetical protein
LSGFEPILLGPTQFVKLQKKVSKDLSHLPSYPNLQEPDG